MNRRDVLKTIAAVSIVGLPAEAEAKPFADVPGFIPAPEQRYPVRLERDFLRQDPEGPGLGCSDASKEIGDVFIEYHEVWERYAEATFDPEIDKKNRKRLSQVPTGRKFRVVGHYSPEQAEDEARIKKIVDDATAYLSEDQRRAARLVVLDPSDFMYTVLVLIKELHIWSDDTDFVIAEDAEHAVQLWKRETGYDRSPITAMPVEDDHPALDPKNWEMWPEDKLFHFTEELDGDESRISHYPDRKVYEWFKFDQVRRRPNVFKTPEEYARTAPWRRVYSYQDVLVPGGLIQRFTVYGEPADDVAFIRHRDNGGWDAARDAAIRAAKKGYRTVYEVTGVRVNHRTTAKLPHEWVAEHPAGFFASTEF